MLYMDITAGRRGAEGEKGCSTSWCVAGGAVSNFFYENVVKENKYNSFDSFVY